MTNVIDLLSDSESPSENNDDCDFVDLSQNIDLNSDEKLHNFHLEDLPNFSLRKNTNNENIEGSSIGKDNFSSITKNNKFNIHENESDDIISKYLTSKENLNTIEEISSKKRKTAPNVLEQKLKKDAVREEKRREREEKKARIAAEKAIKKNLATFNKNKKPEECMKYVTCIFDTNLSSEFGPDIFDALNSTATTVSVESQIIANTVTWKRECVNTIINEEVPNTLYTSVAECALILPWKELVNLIHEKKLVDHISSTQSILCDKKLFLIASGLESYFRYHKNKTNYETNKEKQKTSNVKHKIFINEPKITRKQLEYALTELQILCNCNYRNAVDINDIGIIIMQMTKSIAQEPFKVDKKDDFEDIDWHLGGDNKDSVKVDQKGNGLKRLWQQQLTVFPLARLETADAIITKYSTPSQLVKAYNHCESGSEKEKLLQDIPIRRAAGPLTSLKKIGSELSKKVAIFFTSLDGEAII